VMEVYATDEFVTWYRSLGDEEQEDAVDRAIGLLAQRGVSLGFPYSSALKGTEFALRELRITARKHELRVIYAFDPKRDAVLILGGDKAGAAEFYKRIIPAAEKIWRQYLAEQADGLHEEDD
jgi:hypothetical protein